MHELQDVKEVFTAHDWQERVEQNPKRIYGFLLCADEHEKFVSFIQSAWRTLDALSGEACDIFTFERWEHPDERFSKSGYLELPGQNYGPAGLYAGEQLGIPGQQVAIDNGIMLPGRTQCLAVRDRLFTDTAKIILPGFAVFPSIHGKEALYFRGNGLDSEALSEIFQQILGRVKRAYQAKNTSEEVFVLFKCLETMQSLKERLSKALLSLSLMDMIDLLTDSLKLVMPKGKDGSL